MISTGRLISLFNRRCQSVLGSTSLYSRSLQQQRYLGFCLSRKENKPVVLYNYRFQHSESDKSPSEKPSVGAVTWRMVLFALGGVGILAGVSQFLKHLKRKEHEKERIKSLGKADIGGPFELTDHDGKPRTNEDFKGQWALLYFGFTHCPDICPDEIEKMVQVVNMVEESGAKSKITPLFISVDPARDTPSVVKKYCLEFSPKLLGLTGTEEQIRKVSKAYRVYFSMGPKDEQNDYIVDHTIIMYLINPDGQFVDYYGRSRTAPEITTAIQLHMAKYKQITGRWF